MLRASPSLRAFSNSNIVSGGKDSLEYKVTHDKSTDETTITLEERNPMKVFQLKTKFQQRKTSQYETEQILPLITSQLYNY